MITTKYDPPPIPLRSHDWSATFTDATPDFPGAIDYVADPETGESPVGWGETEAEAIDALLIHIT